MLFLVHSRLSQKWPALGTAPDAKVLCALLMQPPTLPTSFLWGFGVALKCFVAHLSDTFAASIVYQSKLNLRFSPSPPLQTERLALRDFTSSRQPSKWAPAGGRAVTMTRKSPEPAGIFSNGLRGRWCPTICPKIAYMNGVPRALKILSGRKNDTSTRRQKLIFATLPHPTITKMNQLLSASWAIADATRLEYRNARFMIVPVMRVCCRGV